jgi:hypothetical protein
MFFFEKKNQKTFAFGGLGDGVTRARSSKTATLRESRGCQLSLA